MLDGLEDGLEPWAGEQGGELGWRDVEVGAEIGDVDGGVSELLEEFVEVEVFGGVVVDGLVFELGIGRGCFGVDCDHEGIVARGLRWWKGCFGWRGVVARAGG